MGTEVGKVRALRAKADLALLAAINFGEASEDAETSTEDFHDEAIELERCARAFAAAQRKAGAETAVGLSHIRPPQRDSARAFLAACVAYDPTCSTDDVDAWKRAVLELERTAREHYAATLTTRGEIE